MDMYGSYSPSIAQKFVIVVAEVALVAVSFLILFGDLLPGVRAFGEAPSLARNATLFAFNVVVFVRMMGTLFVFVQRKLPWSEAATIPLAFALYYLGFPLMARGASVSFGALETAGIALFAIGSFVNTFAEYQRRRYKADEENRGKLYTGGLFSLSMHVNYFGDLLWVSGYACVTHNPYAALVPAFLFSFFYFGNIPKLDAHLREHYGEQFARYEAHTKRLIPFVL